MTNFRKYKKLDDESMISLLPETELSASNVVFEDVIPMTKPGEIENLIKEQKAFSTLIKFGSSAVYRVIWQKVREGKVMYISLVQQLSNNADINWLFCGVDKLVAANNFSHAVMHVGRKALVRSGISWGAVPQQIKMVKSYV